MQNEGGDECTLAGVQAVPGDMSQTSTGTNVLGVLRGRRRQISMSIFSMLLATNLFYPESEPGCHG